MLGFGGFPSFGGGSAIGHQLIRIGADFRGLHAETRRAMGQMRAEMAAGAAGLRGATAQTAALNKQLATTQTQAAGVGRAMKVAFLGVGAAIGGFLAMTVKSAISFESAFAGVEKTVEASAETLARLRTQFIDLSKEIPVAATELARIGEAAGALGVPTESIMEFTKVVATMAQTTDVSSEQAATSLGQLSNVLKLNREDYSRFAATLVDLGNKGASTESQILEMAARAGGAAKLLGLSTQDVLSFSSSVANLGIRVEAGGSSLQKFFLELNKTVGAGGQLDAIGKKVGLTGEQVKKIAEEGGSDLTRLARKAGMAALDITKAVGGMRGLSLISEITGVAESDFTKLFNKKPTEAIMTLLDGLSKLDKTARQSALATLGFDDIRITRMLLGMADNVDMVSYALETGRAAWDANTAAAEEAEKRYKTTASSMAKIRNVIQAAFIGMGDEILPAFKDFLAMLADAIPAAIDSIATMWQTHFEKPVGRVIDALIQLGQTFGEVFFNWTGQTDDMAGGMNVVAQAVAGIVDGIANLIEGFNDLMQNPIAQWLARILVLVTGLKVGMAALSTMRGVFSVMGRGAAGAVGLGRFLPGQTSDTMDMKAAGLQMTAAELQMAAARSQMGRGAMMAATGMAGSRINYIGRPGMAVPLAAGATAFGRIGAAGFGMQGQTIGRTMVRGMAQQIGQGAREAMRAGGNFMRGSLGLISRAFWPAFVASFAAELAAGPIGSFIKNNTQFKRLGESFERGFLDGLGGLLQTVVQGTDAFVGRPETYGIGSEGSTGEAEVLSSLVARVALITDTVDEASALMDEIDEDLAAGRNSRFAAQRLAQYIDEMLPPIKHLADATLDLQSIGRMADAGPLEQGALAVLDFINTLSGGASLQDADIEGTRSNAKETYRAYVEANKVLAEEYRLADDEIRELVSLARSSNPTAEQRDRLQELQDAVRDGFREQVAAAQRSLSLGIQQAAEELGFEISPEALGRLGLNLGAGEQALDTMMATNVPDFIRQWQVSRLAGEDVGLLPNQQGAATVEEWLEGLEAGEEAFETWAEQQEAFLTKAGKDAVIAYVNEWSEEFERVDPLSDRKRAALLQRFLPTDEDIQNLDLSKGSKLTRKDRRLIDQRWRESRAKVQQGEDALGLTRMEERADAAGATLAQMLADPDFVLSNVETTDTHDIRTGEWKGSTRKGKGANDLMSQIAPMLVDGIGDAGDDIKERMGGAVWAFVMESLGKGGLKGADNEQKQALIGRLNDVFGGLFEEGTVIEGIPDLKMLLAAKLADDLETADTEQEKNDIKTSFEKLFPKKIKTWDDIEKLIEGGTLEEWQGKWETISGKAEEAGEPKIESMMETVLGPVSEKIDGLDLNSLSGAIGSIINNAVEKADELLPTLTTAIDKVVAQARRLEAAASAAATAGGGGGGGGGGGDEEEGPVAGGAGLSFDSNMASLDVAGGAALSFLSNAASLDGAALAAGAAPDFGGLGGLSDFPDMSGSVGGGDMMGSTSSEQNIYVAKMNLMGEHEETGILQTLSFMDPSGGGSV